MAKKLQHWWVTGLIALLLALGGLVMSHQTASANYCTSLSWSGAVVTATGSGSFARLVLLNSTGGVAAVVTGPIATTNGGTRATFDTSGLAPGTYRIQFAHGTTPPTSPSSWSNSSCSWKLVEAEAIGDYECNSQEWHFVINGLNNIQLAPPFIWVEFSSGAIVQVARDDGPMSDSVAHYTYIGHLDEQVVRAWTSISTSYLRFNLSHGPGSCPLPPPVCNSVSVTDNVLTWSSTPEGLQSEVRNSGGTVVAGGVGSINIGSWIADTYFLFVTNDLGVTWSAQNSACSFTIEPPPPPVCLSMRPDRVSGTMLVFEYTPSEIGWVRLVNADSVVQGPISIGSGNLTFPTSPDTYWGQVSVNGDTWSELTDDCKVTVLPPPPPEPMCLSATLNGAFVDYVSVPANLFARVLDGQANPVITGNGPFDVSELVPGPYSVQVTADQENWFGSVACSFVISPPPPPAETVVCEEKDGVWGISYAFNIQRELVLVQEGTSPNPSFWLNGSGFVPLPGSGVWWWNVSSLNKGDYCGKELPPPPPTPVCTKMYVDQVSGNMLILEYSPDSVAWLRLVNANSVVQGPISVGSGNMALPTAPDTYWGQVSIDGTKWSELTSDCKVTVLPPPPPPVYKCESATRNSDGMVSFVTSPAGLTGRVYTAALQPVGIAGVSPLTGPVEPGNYFVGVQNPQGGWIIDSNRCGFTVPELPPPPPTPRAECVSEWENGALVRFGVRYTNIPASELVTTYRPGVANERYTTDIVGAGFVMFAREGEDMTLGPWGWEIASANLSGSCGSIGFLPIIDKQPPPPPEPEPVYGCRWLTAADVVLVEGKAEVESGGGRTLFHNRLPGSTVELNVDPGQWGIEVFSADNEIKVDGDRLPARWLRPTGEVPLDYTGDMQIAASSVPGGPYFDTTIKVIGATADSPGVAICRWEEVLPQP